MRKKIALVAGDGIGPEIMTEAVQVLEQVGRRFGHRWEYTEALAGGAAYDVCGCHLPAETLTICSQADAVLFGAVGGPVNAQNDAKWRGAEKAAILGLRQYFSLNVNLRPVPVFPSLLAISPLKNSLLGSGLDLLIIRELAGDVYFGKHETFRLDNQTVARDEMLYGEEQIRSLASAAFRFAAARKNKICSVDKANVLDTSLLWREVFTAESRLHPAVELTHLYVDNAAMQLIKNPRAFDIIATGNLFGDILSDLAAVLAGSLGLLPSASLNADGFGLYEPAGGSAPDIAGQGKANPIGQILSAALLLRHSFGLEEEARAVYAAVEETLAAGWRTPDIALPQEKTVDTAAMGAAIRERI